MSKPSSGSALERLVAPWPLLLGVAVAFGGCCLAGRLVSHRNHLHHFNRFHMLISPQGLYYPTAGQVRALARNTLDRDKVAVIVAGSSVTYGGSQKLEHCWTKRLQDELGDGYQVLNLALPGGRPSEIGAVAAEFLGREYK